MVIWKTVSAGLHAAIEMEAYCLQHEWFMRSHVDDMVEPSGNLVILIPVSKAFTSQMVRRNLPAR
jgi:hypothetical protein